MPHSPHVRLKVPSTVYILMHKLFIETNFTIAIIRPPIIIIMFNSFIAVGNVTRAVHS